MLATASIMTIIIYNDNNNNAAVYRYIEYRKFIPGNKRGGGMVVCTAENDEITDRQRLKRG